MKIIESVDVMREYSRQLKREGKTIASVDTDAELHEGHMSLVKIAKENADVVVLISGHSVDYKKMTEEEYKKKKLQYRYHPDGFLRDIKLSKSNGVDVFFYPPENQIYVDDLSIPIEMCEKAYDFIRNRDIYEADEGVISTLQHSLCMHFPVFKVVMPDISMVGQKDVCQVFAIKSLIKQLNLPIKVIMAPIIRDSDGLACSSRNVYLTQSERQNATSIYQSLQEVSSWSKIESINYIKTYITHRVKSEYCYISICCAETLEELNILDRAAIIMITAKFGEYGYMDNIFIYQCFSRLKKEPLIGSKKDENY